MDNPRNEGFTFGGIDSRDFGVCLTGVRNRNLPSRDVTRITVPGRSGTLTVDNKRWNDVRVVYSCAVLADFEAVWPEFMGQLLALTGYQRLTDTASPLFYRMAMLDGPVDPETFRKNRGGIFDLSFTCKPQKFLTSGEAVSTFSASGTIVNSTLFPAAPLITVYGSGAGSLTVGGVTVQILALADQITLDCETMNAYRKVGDGAAVNKNGDIYAMEFPVLEPGSNPVSWTGGISRVEIIPRWWTL